MKNIYKLLFISWLKYHNIYSSFYYNRNNSPSYWLDRNFLELNENHYVDAAFDWDKTKERFDYWCRVSSKWERFISKFKNDYSIGKVRGKKYGRMFIRDY